jgi:hypothetical protein
VPDEIITPEMAVALQQRALEHNDIPVWVISEDEPEHPGVPVARLITDGATPYVMIASSLLDLRAMLPPGLTRRARQAADPDDVVEVWLSET